MLLLAICATDIVCEDFKRKGKGSTPGVGHQVLDQPITHTRPMEDSKSAHSIAMSELTRRDLRGFLEARWDVAMAIAGLDRHSKAHCIPPAGSHS